MLGSQHTLVLPYLENLCGHDETVVRERDVSSITKLLDLYNDNDFNNYIITLVENKIYRWSDLHQMRLILLAGSQQLYLCATYILEQAQTNRKYDSKEHLI